jgi:hypothetical protein
MQIFKDQACTVIPTTTRPLKAVAPATGGTKTISFWIQLQDADIQSGCFLMVQVAGPNLYASPQVVSVAFASLLPNQPFLCAVNGQQLFNIQMHVATPAGPTAEYNNWWINACTFVDITTPLATASANCSVVRIDNFLTTRCRVLPAARRLLTALPGFQFGTYRWRDQTQINGVSVVPTQWDADVDAIGTDKFIAGIGQDPDLAYQDLEKVNHSIYARIQHGTYFTGTERYFCPSQSATLDIFRVSASELKFSLSAVPRAQLPVFIGTYGLDDYGYYEAAVRYRDVGCGNPFDLSGNPQAWLDRAGQTVTINQPPAAVPSVAFAGFAPADSSITLNLPVFPMWSIVSVYLETPDNVCAFSGFNQQQGTVTVVFPADSVGMRIFIAYEPAVAVYYEADISSDDGTLLLTDVELNPAFAGIANGFIYLTHGTQKVGQIVLSADKPRILIPATYSSIVGLVAFGPVYYENDYALLMANVTDASGQNPIPNVRLQIIPGADFEGSINYLDPTASPIQLVTGGDGSAAFVYTPNSAYGFYLDPPTSITGAKIILPEAVPFSQLWNADEQWGLVHTYQVNDNQPYLGMIGANPALGEVAWQTWGNVGSVDYKTNGQRVLWTPTGSTLEIKPQQAYDVTGTAALISGAVNPAFNGNAVVLEYPVALPTGGSIGAYFVSFIGRISLQVMDVDSGVLSNTILLQLDAPPVVQDSPGVAGYLYLNALQGRLNVNRLGGAPPPVFAFTESRY